MSKHTLRVPGLATPRWILWIHGWFQGHVLKSGGLDPETERISSSYITGKCRLFHKACVVRMEALEKKLQKDWLKVDELLVDHKKLSAMLKQGVLDMSDGTDSARARAKEKNAKVRTGLEEQYHAVLKELVAVSGRIQSEEQLALDQMRATAEKQKSAFSAYGHGLILEPIYDGNLPELIYMEEFEDYCKAHRESRNALDKITSEVKEAV